VVKLGMGSVSCWAIATVVMLWGGSLMRHYCWYELGRRTAGPFLEGLAERPSAKQTQVDVKVFLQKISNRPGEETFRLGDRLNPVQENLKL